MATERIAIRQDTASNWETANPTLASGEQGHESDTGRRKIGDGATAWNSLGYMYGTAATADTTTSATDTTEGRVTRVGDFGLGSVSRQSSWDGITRNQFNSAAIGNNVFMGVSLAHGSNSGYATQIAGRDNEFRARTKEDDVWMDWVELYHTGNLEVEDSI